MTVLLLAAPALADPCTDAPYIQKGQTFTAHCTGYLVSEKRADELLEAELIVETSVKAVDAAEKKADKAEKKSRRKGKMAWFFGGSSTALIVVVVILVAL